VVGALICTPVFLIFRRHPLVSLRLAILSVRLSGVSRSPFGPCCRFPCVSRRYSFPFLAPVVVFRLHPVGAVTPVVSWLPAAPAWRSSCASSPGGGAIKSPRISWRSGLQLEGLPESLFHCFLSSQQQLDFMASSIPSAKVLPTFLLKLSSGSAV
jgi:hypothetical protein